MVFLITGMFMLYEGSHHQQLNMDFLRQDKVEGHQVATNVLSLTEVGMLDWC